MAASRPGQSAWSDNTKPRSIDLRRRVPRMRIHPEAKAVESGPKRRIQGEPCAEGGASTMAWVQSKARWQVVGGRAFGAARRPRIDRRGSCFRRRRGIRSGRSLDRAPRAGAAPCRLDNRRSRCNGLLAVDAPPFGDVGHHLRRFLPAVNGEAEGGFRHERMAADGLEGRAGGVGREFVIAGDDPDLAVGVRRESGRSRVRGRRGGTIRLRCRSASVLRRESIL